VFLKHVLLLYATVKQGQCSNFALPLVFFRRQTWLLIMLGLFLMFDCWTQPSYFTLLTLKKKGEIRSCEREGQRLRFLHCQRLRRSLPPHPSSSRPSSHLAMLLLVHSYASLLCVIDHKRVPQYSGPCTLSVSLSVFSFFRFLGILDISEWISFLFIEPSLLFYIYLLVHLT